MVEDDRRKPIVEASHPAKRNFGEAFVCLFDVSSAKGFVACPDVLYPFVIPFMIDAELEKRV
ncbi:MAG: hypothetical protein HRU46_10125 [Verrucomicrobiales bacterium]|nr:hypothetical protein [Verrucomicrobiales bacterium]